MDKQIVFKELLIDEDILIGCSAEIIEIILGVPDSKKSDEWVYTLKEYCFGLFKKKLHVYFSKEEVRDYYIGI